MGWVWIVLAACTSDPADAEVPAVPADPGGLLIAQLYYAGAPAAGGADHYFSDQLVELVNTSAEPFDASGVMIADAFGAAGVINPGMEPDSFAARRPGAVVLSSVWRLPEGTVLEPGATLLIAHDGTNHRPFSPLDLSGADLEAFVAGSGGDDDHPTVPNLEEVTFNGGYDWLMPVFGASVVLLAADARLDTVRGPYGELPIAAVEDVLDGVDALMDADSGAFKRLPDAVDRGFVWVGGTYTGEALHRRRDGAGWQDTDDASADFEVGPPTVDRAAAAGAVFGDPWLELGTGSTAFAPLGPDVELVAGAQGGWHLDAAVAFGGFGPDGVVLRYEALWPDAREVSFPTFAALTATSVLPSDGGWHRVGDRVVLDVASAEDVVDQELILRVTAELDGQSWSDERRARVVDER